MNPPLLQAIKLTRSFPGVRALTDVNLDIEPGKVHALMGENGAGKSTLMRILAGLDQPDFGEVRFQGHPVKLTHPHQALQLGIAMIHQELLTVPELSVAENIFLGLEPGKGLCGWIDRPAMNAEAARLLRRLRADISPLWKMKTLSVAAMQTVEIARALAHQARVIIMDEPTSALATREVEALFEVIQDLTRQGVAIIYISHKMEEIFRMADTVTVMRDGRHITTQPIAELNTEQLIRLMVGRELGSVFHKIALPRGQVVLEVRQLGHEGVFRDINFTVRAGEILGITGLMGAGRTELLRALSGLSPANQGELLLHGKLLRIRHPQDALANGIGLVSEDRKLYGLVPTLSVKHNLTLSYLWRRWSSVFIDHHRENAIADEQIAHFGIKTPSRNQTVTHLSGGNQQKVVIAKTLLVEPEVWLLDEPTRGIDVGAKAEIYTIITQLAAQGKAIVLVSSELPEVLALSDRLLVLRQGAISAELDPRLTSPEEIMRYAMLN